MVELFRLLSALVAVGKNFVGVIVALVEGALVEVIVVVLVTVLVEVVGVVVIVVVAVVVGTATQ